MRLVLIALLVVSVAACATGTTPQVVDPLPSWNAGAARSAIVEFVERVSTPGSADFVPEAARIAVFDNDGTLWSEQPMYFQLAFALDRVKELASANPEWANDPLVQAVLADDMPAVLAGGEHGIARLVMLSHAGMTSDEFREICRKWIAEARHPRFDRPYPELVFQPMLELLDYLRANGFRTWIVSGGGIEFLRVFAEEVYGIPPEQVIGSSLVTEVEMREGEPVLVRRPELDFLDDKEGKVVAINLHIGRRPIAAFGNSDGDLRMMQWTAAGDGPRFALFVRHTDAEREWAYDRESHIGRLDEGLDEAAARGWTVVDMKNDWKVVYPAEP